MANVLVTIESLVYIYLLSLVGRLVFKRFNIHFENTIGKTAYILIAGYAIVAIGGFILALFGLFDQIALFVLFAIVIFLGREFIKNDVSFSKKIKISDISAKTKTFFSQNIFLKILLVVWLIANFAVLFMPITGGDSINYHLPMMSDMVRQGKIVSPIAGISDFGNLPALIELSYGIPTLLFNNWSYPFIFALLQYLSLLLIIALVVDFAKKRAENIPSSMVALAILSIFDLQRVVMDGGYIDSFVALFIIASVLLTIESVEREFKPNKFYLGALLTGVALSAKYTALFIIPANFAVILVSMYLLKIPFPKIAKHLFFYFLLALAVCGYWYGKNVITFLNPFYPMFSDKNFSDPVNVVVLHRNFFNFIIFPIYLFAEKLVSVKGSLAKLICSGYFLFLYGSIVCFAFNWKKVKFGAGSYMLFLAMEIYLLFIFLSSHNSRFVIPATVFGVILSAIVLQRIILLAGKSNYPFKFTFLKIGYLFISFIFFIMLLGNFSYFQDKFFVLSGKLDKNEYISDRIGKLYYVTLYINKNFKNEKIAIIWPIEPYSILSGYYLENGNSYARMGGEKNNDQRIGTIEKPRNYFIVGEAERTTLIKTNSVESQKILAEEKILLNNSSFIYSYGQEGNSYKLYKFAN
ncbi:MAG: hypothetical protein WCT19_00350 [Candidatus Paceibacterota bacterium]